MGKQENEFKSLKKVNDYLFRALERLDDDNEAVRDSNYVARANAIIAGSKAILNVARVGIQLQEMKENNMDIKPIVKLISNEDE